MAEALPICRVKGIQMVMATAVPRPGSAPTTVPNIAPMHKANRQSGLIVIMMPCMISENIRFSRGLEQADPEGLRDDDAQNLLEHQPRQPRAEQGEGDHAPDVPVAHQREEEEQEEERPEGKPHRSEQDDIDGDGRDDFGNARQAGPQIVGVERLSGVEQIQCLRL